MPSNTTYDQWCYVRKIRAGRINNTVCPWCVLSVSMLFKWHVRTNLHISAINKASLLRFFTRANITSSIITSRKRCTFRALHRKCHKHINMSFYALLFNISLPMMKNNFKTSLMKISILYHTNFNAKHFLWKSYKAKFPNRLSLHFLPMHTGEWNHRFTPAVDLRSLGKAAH